MAWVLTAKTNRNGQFRTPREVRMQEIFDTTRNRTESEGDGVQETRGRGKNPA
jgi:hypothetical protein